MRVIVLIVLLAAMVFLACSWLGSGGSAALKGARVAAVKTARAGAIASKYTYRGGRKAVTWTGARTADGTTATLEALNLIERPVPPSILEKIPDEVLASLTSLHFINPVADGQVVVISSPDTRWEGEVFYRAAGDCLEFEVEGASEMIVVTLSAADREDAAELNSYKVYVQEDKSELGEIRFATSRAETIWLYGYPGWHLSEPGVFVINALQGRHRYRIGSDISGGDGFLLVACFLPRYHEVQQPV
jgi:hypothetical protein